MKERDVDYKELTLKLKEELLDYTHTKIERYYSEIERLSQIITNTDSEIATLKQELEERESTN